MNAHEEWSYRNDLTKRVTVRLTHERYDELMNSSGFNRWEKASERIRECIEQYLTRQSQTNSARSVGQSDIKKSDNARSRQT